MAVSKSMNEPALKPVVMIEHDSVPVKSSIKIDPKSAEVYKTEGLGWCYLIFEK